jgi:mono/diheme cytochrome c family protein
MKHFVFTCAVLALVVASPAVLKTSAVQQSSAPRPAATAPAAAGAAAPQQAHQAMLTTYCYTCHSTTAKMGGLALQGLSIQAAGDNAEVWEKAVRKLRGRLMPPPGSPQPEQKDIDSFVGWMENKLDTNPKAPKAGHTGIHRLSRVEYAAAVKALVGVDVIAKDVLPQDAAVEGFDNIASALTVSPTFIEQYVEAARVIAKKAVGDSSLDATTYAAATFRGTEAMPLGLRDGGMRLKHNFTIDGEYRFNFGFPDGTSC